MSLFASESGVNVSPVSWVIEILLLVLTSLPSEVFIVPPLGTAVIVIVRLSPSASVGALILSGTAVESSSTVIVLSASALGAELVGGLGAG